jgi:predicted transcriptional regulator with HTH domain
MQLSQLSLANPLIVTWHTKRSLFQLHILFLGLFIEPYRTCLADLGKSRLSDPSSRSEDLEIMKELESNVSRQHGSLVEWYLYYILAI